MSCDNYAGKKTLARGIRNLVKGRGLVRLGDQFRATNVFRYVEVNRADYSAATLCRVLGVFSSGYYAWRNRDPSTREATDAALTARIESIHACLLRSAHTGRTRQYAQTQSLKLSTEAW